MSYYKTKFEDLDEYICAKEMEILNQDMEVTFLGFVDGNFVRYKKNGIVKTMFYCPF